MYYEYTSTTKQGLTSVKIVLTSTILLVIFYTSTKFETQLLMMMKMMNCFCGMADQRKAYFLLGPLSEIFTIADL